MSFLAPAFAALAALAALIVAQYFLKLRRPLHTLPSTFLWQRALADTRANAPWQRLRPDPLLILQLLALLALVLALMRPYVLRAGAPSRNIVTVLDASLGARMLDGGRSRFAAEIAAARGLVDDLAPGHTMSLIRMDSHPRVLIAASGDHDALKAVLSSQQPGYDTPDARTALGLAYGLAGQGAGASQSLVEILRSAATSTPPVSSAIPTRDRVFGASGAPNLGIAAFGASKAADGSTSAIIRVVNSGAETLGSDLAVYSDGTLQDVESVRVAPGDSQLVTPLGLPSGVHALRASLTLHDALSADDVAWTTLNAGTTRRVVLVTGGDIFVRAALAGAPDLGVAEITPGRYSAAAVAGADLVIFDGWLPAAFPPANLLLIDPPRGRALGIEIGAPRGGATPRIDDDPAGLLRYMTPANIHIASARALSAPGWVHVALRDSRGPLLLEAAQGLPGRGPGRLAVLGFAPSQSDLWASLDFPVFVDNLLTWLAPGLRLDATAYAPGSVVLITLAAGARRAIVVLPDGTQRALPPTTGSGSTPFADTAQPGLYTVEEQVGASRLRASFSVNSALPTSAPDRSGGARSALPAAPPSLSAGRVPVDLTGIVAAVVLSLLAAEWYVAMRRR